MQRIALPALLAAAAVVAGGCGHGAREGAEARPAVPDVRGLAISDAVQRLVARNLCVRLEIDRGLRSPAIGRESPAPGTRLAEWQPVTIVAGLPAGASNAGVDVDVFGDRKTPCPPIRARS